MALQVGVESLCYAMDSNEIPEVLEDQSLPYLEGEFKLLGNMFKHEKLMKTDREKILVADIPYNIPSLGDGIWNKSSPFFLPRFLKMVARVMAHSGGQSLIFCSWEQSREIQKQLGGRILYTVETSEEESSQKRVMKNRVQTAVYTLWGEHKFTQSHAFADNVMEYGFVNDERLRDIRGFFVNPGQKAKDLLTKVLIDMACNTFTDHPQVLDLCSGTGTTAVVAGRMGLDVLSFEQDETYRQLIHKRYQEAMTQHRRRRGVVFVQQEDSSLQFGEAKKDELKVRQERLPEVADERDWGHIDDLKQSFPDLFYVPDHGFSRECKLPPLVLTPKSDAKFGKARPINTSYKETEFIRDQFDAMEKAGIVSRSKTTICSPVFCVPKPPNLLRMVCNFKKVDRELVHTVNVLPNPELDIFSQLHGCTKFSAIDLTTAYYSVLVEENSRKYTGVVLRDGRVYEFNRMPMGFQNAPHHFQTALASEFADLPFVHVFLDDLIIASKPDEDHWAQVTEVFRRLDALHFTVAMYKCQFGFDQLNYLGFTVGINGLQMNADKQDKISNLPQPKDVSGVRRLLGVSGFYRKFVPHYATITAPITELLKKDQIFEWTEEHDQALSRLKEAIAKDITLALPDFTKDFIIYSDASQTGVGGMLAQRDDVTGELRPISFVSRKLTSAEKNYTITELELLAIVFCFMKWRHYLHMVKFQVYTDHKALTYFRKCQNLSGRLARWHLLIESFDFDLYYVQGEANEMADFWSREGALLTEAQIQSDLKKVASLRGGDIDQYFERFCFSSSVRPSNWEDFVKFAHGFGHFGSVITTNRLRNLVNWPGMKDDVSQVISKCHVCAKGNHARIPRVPLQIRDDANEPMMVLEIDHVKGLIPSADGMKFILSVKDVFSGYVMFIPVPTDSAQDTVRALWINWFSRFGFPTDIKSDQGPGFAAQLTHQFNVLVGIHHRFSAPHAPRSHGNIEVSHKGLNAQLRKLTNHENWSLQVPLIGYNMNTAVSQSRGFAPVEIVFGRNFTTGQLDNLAIKDRWEFMTTVLWPLVRFQRGDSKKKMKEAYDKFYEVTDRHFQEGQVVYVQNPPRGRKKHSDVFAGPYLIESVNADRMVVRVRDPVTNKLLKSDINFDRLKTVQITKEDIESGLLELQSDEEYEVITILDHEFRNGKLFYLLEYAGYPEPEWNGAENCEGMSELVNEYWAKLGEEIPQ